jgi:hypothetical protein
MDERHAETNRNFVGFSGIENGGLELIDKAHGVFVLITDDATS